MTNMKKNVGPTLHTIGKKAVTDYRIPVLAVLLFVVMALLKPNFATSYNIYTITDSAAKSGIAAIGFTFILLVGQLDISFGSVISLSACVFMMMLKAEMNFALAVVVALVVGMACGTLTGFFVANFRLSPFIVSMTMQLVYKGIALTITKSTPVAMTHPVLKAINSVKLLDMIPLTFLFFLVLVFAAEFFLRRTQFGRNIFLVGGNISVSDNLGIKSSRYVWSAYIIQGFFAALAGIAMMTRTSSANGNIGAGSLLDVIPMVIVGGTSMAGGKGGCIKTLWGVLLLSMVYNSMTFFSIPAPLQPFVKGLILLVVIVSDKYMERRHEKV
ncbi:MAG: ABC transporter permease [Ruminococcaceae bacterium]|nr:ABC transporter permease [Oscillospiraceae bacterium]